MIADPSPSAPPRPAPEPPQILEVKEMLQEKEGIDTKQIRLIHNGKQLQDTETLEASKIDAGVTIHMVLSLRGGSA